MELNKIIFLHAVLPVFQQPRRKIVCISEMHIRESSSLLIYTRAKIVASRNRGFKV